MKHKPIFRLALLALLLAGCGKDTTELPEGPETPATGGDAIVCRLSIGNEAPDPTDETRTAYGPLQDGYYPIYWRNADRVGIICPQTTPQWAEVEVSVSGATESEADLSDTGMQWGSSPSYDFYAFYPADAVHQNGGGNNGNGGVLRTADLHLAEQRLASVYDVFCQRSDLVSGILLRGESLAPGLVCPSGWHFMHPEKKWTVPLIMIGVSIAYFA